MVTMRPTLTVPTRFADFHQRHAGESILVCGCGSSLNQLQEAEHYVTIGVNDVGRKFHPDYLVVLNGRHQFSAERFAPIAASQAQAIFTHLSLGIDHPNVVRFLLGQRGGVEVNTLDSLPYTRNSTYVAACLAIFMGAKRIGLIGVDFTDHHFFAPTGRHSLSAELARIRQEYARLAEACTRLGVELVNLSAQSAVDTLPYEPLAAFSARAKSAKSLNIVSYATTPVAGVPKLLSECIERCTPHRCRTVWATHRYGNGVEFAGDVEWQHQPDMARALLEAADLVIVHNGHTAAQHNEILRHKPVITLAHNYMWNVDQQFVKRGLPGMVVAQYQASLPEFAGWQAVPNPVPLWDPLFALGEKEQRITIAYTPSGKHEKYPPGHRLYWHSKGYISTMAVLQRLAQRYPLQLLTTQSGQVSFSESMEIKRRAHIVIDECVTGSYHRNSLEGLAAGAVVINGLGLESAISDVFQRTVSAAPSPFVCASLATLEMVLTDLIASGPQRLTEQGIRNRQWLLQHWDFSAQWQQFWLPQLANARGKMPPAPNAVQAVKLPARVSVSAPPQTLCIQTPLTAGVSVIIPFAGNQRTEQLRCVLLGLKKQPEVKRIIVVELDRSANAREIATGLADDYLFAYTQQPFSKSRALNIALPFVTTQYILWLDSDLLLPEGFIQQARDECEHRGLDCLIPWDTVYYLGQNESEQIQQGVRQPGDVQPVHQFQSRRGAQGGAVLVRTDFILQHGGMPVQFQGWGGEDNAWFHKVSVLGKIDYTADRKRALFHLYHPLSSGYCRHGEHIAANPHYQNNFQLLQRMRSARSAATFSQRYPASAWHSAPWDATQAIVCPPSHAALAQRLRDFYGDALSVTPQPDMQAVDLSLFNPDQAALDQTVLAVIRHICTLHYPLLQG
ncbi:glycosyltransferase [Erwinia sorbitola]|uniref:Glycosyltransferase n=1 Tax=Erwinia sorbitola TaxID=2681984 RepID=A0ABW9R9V9_9GAMM|nr:glycosyltransferase [Erwinia sorbitola]MTD26929.1 glycosyltransferase [Erwinia sorbitola]